MTIPGGFVAGAVLTAADMNLLPGGRMGYAQTTADQLAVGSVVDLTSLTVTWTAIAARRYRTSFQVGVFADTVIDTSYGMEVLVTDAANVIKTKAAAFAGVGTGSDRSVTLVGSVCETGLAGSTTRKLRARITSAAADSMTVDSDPTYPAYILVEDIGPA